MRCLYVALACTALVIVACRQNDQCIDDLATRLIESATQGDYLPDSLIEGCEEKEQNEQLELARRISIANLFSADDFVFAVRQMTPEVLTERKRAGLSYSIDPTHEILIYNKKWRPDKVPVLSVDVISDSETCYIAVPKLSPEKFKKMSDFYEKLFVQVDKLSNALNQDRKRELLSLFRSADDYGDGLRSVVKATGADEDTALFLLSRIAKSARVTGGD